MSKGMPRVCHSQVIKFTAASIHTREGNSEHRAYNEADTVAPLPGRRWSSTRAYTLRLDTMYIPAHDHHTFSSVQGRFPDLFSVFQQPDFLAHLTIAKGFSGVRVRDEESLCCRRIDPVLGVLR